MLSFSLRTNIVFSECWLFYYLGSNIVWINQDAFIFVLFYMYAMLKHVYHASRKKKQKKNCNNNLIRFSQSYKYVRKKKLHIFSFHLLWFLCRKSQTHWSSWKSSDFFRIVFLKLFSDLKVVSLLKPRENKTRLKVSQIRKTVGMKRQC